MVGLAFTSEYTEPKGCLGLAQCGNDHTIITFQLARICTVVGNSAWLNKSAQYQLRCHSGGANEQACICVQQQRDADLSRRDGAPPKTAAPLVSYLCSFLISKVCISLVSCIAADVALAPF